MTSAADPRTGFGTGARRGLAALSVLAATLLAGVSTTTGTAAQERCAQPYAPMWVVAVGVGMSAEGGPTYPHDPPFWAGDFGQPDGPISVGGMPPYSYADGVLTVGEGDDQATFEGRVISSSMRASLLEFDGRRYLALTSSNSGPSFKALHFYWDFDDPCRQLPDTSAAPTTSVSPTDDAGSPAGPADPVSGAARYTG